MRSKVAMIVACGAVLTLGACERNAVVVDTTTLERELATAQAAREAAEAALGRAQNALADAQRVLDAATPNDQQAAQERVREVLQTAEENVKTAADGVAAAIETASPDQRPGLEATEKALTSTRTALASVRALFPESARTDMHTPLDRARTALARARTDLAAADRALEAVPNRAAQDALTEARNAITTAQLSLLPRIERELNAAEENLATRTTERDAARADAATQKLRADTYDPRVSLTDALEPRDARFVPRDEAEITRTPRTDTGEAGWEKLNIATDAVAWAAGKRISAGGGLGATDELPLRAVTLRAAGRHPVRIQGDDGSPTSYSNTDGVVTSSLQLSADGATLKFGGAGVIYYDNQRRFDLGANQDSWAGTGPDGKLGDAGADTGTTMTSAHAADLGLESASGSLTAAQATTLVGYALDNPSRFGADRKQGDASAAAGTAMTVAHAADLGLSEPSGNLDADQAAMLVEYAEDNPPSAGCWQEDLSLCGDWNHDDLTIAFGAPSQSPHGDPSQSPHGDPSYYWKVKVPLTEAQREQRLPNRMQEDDPLADGRPEELGTYELWLSNYGGLDTGADDAGDTHRYLEYAAYGLFMVFDNVKATPSFTRPQAFAFGYDAFRDADGMRTTDVSTSIAATFQGHTMARALVNNGDANNIILSGATPLRGDVTLNACIGGSGCTGGGIPADANRISGMISGLEELRHDGVWIPYSPAAGGIPMAEGKIAADGSFGAVCTNCE